MPCSRFQVQAWIERIRCEQEASFCSPEGDFSGYREQQAPFCSPAGLLPAIRLAYMLNRVETYTKIHFSGKYNDVYTTPTKTQRTIFDLLGIKYEYKGEELNAEPEAPQNL